MPNNKIDIEKYIKKLERFKQNIPKVIGNEVKNFALQAFKNQGFSDTGYEPWSPRKNERKIDKGRALLVKTGRLRRSIRVIQATFAKTSVGTDVPYAKYNNDKRKFLGNSAVLRALLKEKIRYHLNKVFDAAS